MDRSITVRTAPLPRGLMGLWDEATRTLWLDTGLTSTERRCTVVHELVHAERGDVPCDDAVLDARQERWVEREAARRLVPLSALIEALRWTTRADELAEVLDVDAQTLAARVAGLSHVERERVLGERSSEP
jgi:hypothetical protein